MNHVNILYTILIINLLFIIAFDLLMYIYDNYIAYTKLYFCHNERLLIWCLTHLKFFGLNHLEEAFLRCSFDILNV